MDSSNLVPNNDPTLMFATQVWFNLKTILSLEKEYKTATTKMC